jgi:hypothetical protein
MVTLLGVLGVLVVVATVVDIRGRRQRHLVTGPDIAVQPPQPPFTRLTQSRPADTP